jgi:putative hydrolase of the HAD superfamily
MTGQVDAVVFDLDDTLIDWWGSWTTCVASFAGDDVLDALTVHVQERCWHIRPGTPGHIWHRNTWQIFDHRHDLWPQALADRDPAEVAALIEQFEQQLWVGFFAEVIPTLDHLARSHRLAVLSNNSQLPGEADRLGLDSWFEHILVAEPYAKPDPRAFHLACDTLGVDPGRTWYVGDSIRADALGAAGAGLNAVWVDRFGDPWPDRPAAIHRIADLAELTTLLS